MNAQDVPSPIDLCDPRDAREWERTAQERPGRTDIFQAIGRELLARLRLRPTRLRLARRISLQRRADARTALTPEKLDSLWTSSEGSRPLALPKTELTILELGSGPGFLAAYLFETLQALSLTLLDFSAPMHDLARATLGRHATGVRFVERSFKEPSWSRGLGYFDAVITNQAVHELRHKRHARQLHAEVKEVLKPGGTYLVSDHFFGEGGLANDQLYMTMPEQRNALLNAGFADVRKVAAAGTLVLHRAT